MTDFETLNDNGNVNGDDNLDNKPMIRLVCIIGSVMIIASLLLGIAESYMNSPMHTGQVCREGDHCVTMSDSRSR